MGNSVVDKEEYFEIGQKTVICLLTLKRGLEVVGVYMNKDKELAKLKAQENAYKRLKKLSDRNAK